MWQLICVSWCLLKKSQQFVRTSESGFYSGRDVQTSQAGEFFSSGSVATGLPDWGRAECSRLSGILDAWS